MGEALSNLVLELKQVSQPEKKGGLGGFFQRSRRRLEEMKAQYAKAEANVDKIVEMLEAHQVTLMKDVAMLDQMYELNHQVLQGADHVYHRRQEASGFQFAPTSWRSCGRRRRPPAPRRMPRPITTWSIMCNRFEKKLHDLELTRVISIQMGPQTRLLQNNDTLMIEKIQTSLVNTIPLWKSQMVLALGLEHSRQATAAQTAVTNMTNDLLRQNAEMLRMGTVETAKEAERSVVDIETLQHTNQELIAALDEVVRIQTEGRAETRLPPKSSWARSKAS